MPIALPHAKAGKLRALAVTGAKPFALTPGIPTAIEAGLRASCWTTGGPAGGKGSPPAIVAKLNANREGVAAAGFRDHYTTLGLEAVTSTPQGFSEAIKTTPQST